MKKQKDLKPISIKDIKPKWYRRKWNVKCCYGGKGAIQKQELSSLYGTMPERRQK